MKAEETVPVNLWWCVVHENQAIPMSNGTGHCYWHRRHECEVVQCLIPAPEKDPSPT